MICLEKCSKNGNIISFSDLSSYDKELLCGCPGSAQPPRACPPVISELQTSKSKLQNKSQPKNRETISLAYPKFSPVAGYRFTVVWKFEVAGFKNTPAETSAAAGVVDQFLLWTSLPKKAKVVVTIIKIVWGLGIIREAEIAESVIRAALTTVYIHFINVQVLNLV